MTDAPIMIPRERSALRADPSGLRRGLGALLLVAAGSCVLTASSYAMVPMWPVPMTMQTLAVVLVGALYGPRLGAATVLSWLAEGAAGLPVFAGGGAGAAHLLGPTGGYLLAFPLAAALSGAIWRARTGAGWARSFAAMLAGNALCLCLGAAWLSVSVGPARAVAAGVLPFLLGALLKSVFGAAALAAWPRRWTVRADA